MNLKIVLFLLLLPLLYLGVGETHDWGDDFAQYLIQAKNINEGIPQEQNDLVFDARQMPYALKAYPAGFPLLLAPMYKFFGLEIKPYLILISLILILASLKVFSFCKKQYDEKIALLIALLFAYNVFSLILKKEILSEWPFILVLYTILHRLQKNNTKTYLSCGILAGVLISFRIAGALIIPAVFLSVLVSPIPQQEKSKRILAFVFPAIIVFALLNVALFGLSIQELLGFYQKQWTSHSFAIVTNLWDLLTNTAAILCQPLHSDAWNFIVLALIITGIVRKFKEQSAAQWFFFLYIGLIAIYPYTSSGFRFLFPIIPLAIIYFAEGVLYVVSSFKKAGWYVGVIGTFTIISIVFSIRFFTQLPPADGPYTKEAREAFTWIQQNTPENTVIAFPRARAMSLYGKRKSTFLVDGISADANKSVFDKLSCKYILYPDERSGAFNDKLQEYLMRTKSSYETVWTNGMYVVLKKRE
ncbi:MAG: hypothetical protein IPP51_14050 [Bacteroidetes bacterium]|nr:hypothetical protein [Bacteroidota bacterium]